MQRHPHFNRGLGLGLAKDQCFNYGGKIRCGNFCLAMGTFYKPHPFPVATPR